MESSLNLKQWTLITHLSGFAGFIFPLGNIIGPLLIWLLKREQSPLLEEHAREALNFQISISIYAIIASILLVAVIGFVLLPILIVVQIALMIKAALAADRGEFYRYPITIRFIKHPQEKEKKKKGRKKTGIMECIKFGRWESGPKKRTEIRKPSKGVQ